jgi:pseudouridine-5'-phosphate glycosidase
MNPKDAPRWLEIHPEVQTALAVNLPVVALESAVITHGLPKPINFETAMDMQAEVRDAGATPAIAAILDGRIHLGIDVDELARLGESSETQKVSLRDFGSMVAQQASGGTTVAATLYVAQAAGVRVFATGGIGGVHRGIDGDVSADLPALARWPVAVVCSGAKAFLDLPRTLEWLETAGIPVIGYQTAEFPAFFSPGSGLGVSARADQAQEVVDLLKAHWDLGLQTGALICVPCPQNTSIPRDQMQAAVREVEDEATAAGMSGPGLTPFVLERLGEKTNGATLEANIALLRNNARVAAEIASLM